MLKLVLVAIVLLSLAFAGLAIRLFFFKGAEFRKSCSSGNTQGQQSACSCGGNENNSCESS